MHLRLRALAVMDPRLWASVGLAALVACGGTAKPPAASTASAPHPSLPSPAFLDLIPADTAYAYMVIDPVDHGGVKSYLRRHEIAAALAGMKDYFSQHRSDMSTQPLVARLLLAAMSEADGDLASLGIDPSPRLAIWGMGLLPVARFELADGAKFRAFAERVFQRAGVHPTEETFQGTRYWLIEDSVDVVVAVIGDEVALSVFPPASKTAILPYVLGEKRPQRSLADVHALAEIQTAAGFEHPNLLGFINFVRAAEAFTTKDRGIHNGVWPGAQLFHDPACAREVPALFETMPRLIFGWEHHDADHISARIVLETRPDITERLARMVAAVPGLSTKATEGTAAAMGIGVDVGEVLDFIALKAAAFAATDHQCPELAAVGEPMQTVATKLAFIGHTPIAGLRGVIASVYRYDLDDPEAPMLAGVGVVGADDPEALFGLLRPYIPALADLKVVPGAPPIEVPGLGLPASFGPVHIAMSHTAIGISVGAEMTTRLTAALAEPPAADPPLMLYRATGDFSNALERATDDDHSDLPPQVAKSMETIKAHSQTKIMTLKVTDQGVVFRAEIGEPAKAASPPTH